MSLFPATPSPLAAALPISPVLFMAITVMSACVYGVIVVFNYLSLKNKSTHRLCILSVVIFLAALLVVDVSVGLTFDSDSADLLANPAGKIALALLVLAAGAGLSGFLHAWWHRHRYRRGRKRALGIFVFSLTAIVVLFNLSNSSRHPHVRVGPKTKVALLPETDAYGRPIATPAPSTPVPAATPYQRTPALPTPVPPEPPTPIATPMPKRLLPSVLTQ